MGDLIVEHALPLWFWLSHLLPLRLYSFLVWRNIKNISLHHCWFAQVLEWCKYFVFRVTSTGQSVWQLTKTQGLCNSHLNLCSNIVLYSLRFKMSVTLAKKNCFKMNVTLHFQSNFNFFLPISPSTNTPTFLLQFSMQL